MWGDVADCLVSAIEALPEDAERPRAQGALFANLVLADTVDAPSVVDSHAFLAAAGLKAEHARLLLDGGSEATLATLVAAGHVTAATEALTATISETKDWDERLALLSAAARWEWCGDGSAWVGRAANEAAAKTLKLALDEMVKPATHGAQRRPFALALTTILRALARGGGDAASVALLPLDAIVDVASSWSQKGNAAAENSALLQSVVALQARLPEKRTDAALEPRRRAPGLGVRTAGGQGREQSQRAGVPRRALRRRRRRRRRGGEAPAHEEIRELLARARLHRRHERPAPALWGRVERALATGAEANPLCALDVAADMLGGEHAVGVSKEVAAEEGGVQGLRLGLAQLARGGAKISRVGDRGRPRVGRGRAGRRERRAADAVFEIERRRRAFARCRRGDVAPLWSLAAAVAEAPSSLPRPGRGRAPSS